MNLSNIFDLSKIDKLLAAKIEHQQLFLFRYKELLYVFRPLTIAETDALVELSSKLNEYIVEDWVVKTTYIISNRSLDYALNKAPYGLTTWFAQKILDKSNIKDQESYDLGINTARKETAILQNNVDMLISKAYPYLGHDLVRKMTQTKQLKLLANAETITGVKLDIGRPKRRPGRFATDATVIGGDDITSPEVADKPEF